MADYSNMGFQESSELDWYMEQEKKTVIVEVDIYHPHGKDVDDWDFIQSFKFDVGTEHLEHDTQELRGEIVKVIQQWRDKKTEETQ